ncbi:nudC domain-containing protein 1 isoform X2 [Periplaneta americana]
MPSNHVRKSGHYNTSLSFPSPEMAVLSDGAGTIHVVSTGSRAENKRWNVMFSDEVCGKEKSFTVLDSRENIANRREIHSLLFWVDEMKKERENGSEEVKFATQLEWITFSEGENQEWSMQSVRQLSGAGGLDYAALEPGCQSLYISSGKPFQFHSDSENPVRKKECVDTKEEKKKPEYFWLQTNEDINIWFSVAEQITKADLDVCVKTNYVKIECKNYILLEGPTWHNLEAEITTWTINKGKLEIALVKAEQGLMWQELVKDDSRGEQIPDPALVEEVHQRLAHLCSDKEIVDSSGNYPPTFNSQQLEECDALPLETSVLVRLDVQTHDVTHKINLGGHQWLFNVPLKADAVPAICLRHDVDGCLWQLERPRENKEWPCTHIGTFLAFGYVQASKTQKKFCSSAPDMSYVAICEASRHIYIYRQPAAISTELRNRRTGQQVAHIAKQQLVNLDSTAEMLGVYASNHILYVLTLDTLYALRISCNSGNEL